MKIKSPNFDLIDFIYLVIQLHIKHGESLLSQVPHLSLPQINFQMTTTVKAILKLLPLWLIMIPLVLNKIGSSPIHPLGT